MFQINDNQDDPVVLMMPTIQNSVELNVSEIPIENLYLDIQQAKERIVSKMRYMRTSPFHTFMMHDIEQGSDEALNIDINGNVIINQDVDELLTAYDTFYKNDCDAFLLTENTTLDFGNGIKALLSLSFIKKMKEPKNMKNISLTYGWQVEDSDVVDQGSLNDCYSYITKRFNATLDNFNQIASSKGLTIETKSRNNEASIVSDPLFNQDLTIGDAQLYKIDIKWIS